MSQRLGFIRQSLSVAFPIMLSYISIGIPCGLLCQKVGLSAFQVFALSIVYYSGAGQFMLPNMWLAGNSLVGIIASISLVNTRQMLYAASFASRCTHLGFWRSFLFAATVTDETFGVNTSCFEKGDWTVSRATLVNIFSQLSWASGNALGVILGSAIYIDLALASFAMTSIFICLLVSQDFKKENIVAAFSAALSVFVLKAVGLSGIAILGGAIIGILVAFFTGGSSYEKDRDESERCLDACASSEFFSPDPCREEQLGRAEP